MANIILKTLDFQGDDMYVGRSETGYILTYEKDDAVQFESLCDQKISKAVDELELVQWKPLEFTLVILNY